MPLDEQDLAKITEIIAATTAESKKETTKMLNGALANLTKGWKEKLDSIPDSDGLAALVKQHVDPVVAELSKKAPEPAKGAPAIDEATQKALADLKAANESLQTRLKKQEEERRAEIAQRMAGEEKQALTAALVKLQIRPGLLEPALDYLRARGMVKRDKDGAIVIERKDDIGGTEMVSLEDGLASWTKTDVGKEFLPPREVGGTGDKSRGGRTSAGGPVPFLTGEQMAEIVRNASE